MCMQLATKVNRTWNLWKSLNSHKSFAGCIRLEVLICSFYCLHSDPINEKCCVLTEQKFTSIVESMSHELLCVSCKLCFWRMHTKKLSLWWCRSRLCHGKLRPSGRTMECACSLFNNHSKHFLWPCAIMLMLSPFHLCFVKLKFVN